MSSRTLAACVFASVCTASSLAWAGAGIEPLTTVRVASGLSRPVFVTYAPGDYTRAFIVEQRSGSTGRIRVLNTKTGVLNATSFLQITGLSTGSEQGLLGLAFHPDYQNNGEFFVNYNESATSGDTVIAKYTVSANPEIANPAGDIIMRFNQPFSNHNGGWIAFSPDDDYLYIGTGDGGSGNDPGNRAQDITNQRMGKLLRIDVDGDDFPGDPNADYAVPSDNPFVGVSGDDEIWAYGLRNPWRSSFDRSNGDLYIGDVGQNGREEISFQRGVGTPFVGGENYGWRCMEGESCTGLSGCTCFDSSLTDPIKTYVYGGSPFRCSIIGGYVYRGCDIPTLQGTYFYADHCSDQIWSFTAPSVSNEVDRTSELDPAGSQSILSPSSFGEDQRGEMYICDLNGGEVFKIIPVTATVQTADVNCDYTVNIDDLLSVLGVWGACDGCAEDFRGGLLDQGGDHIVDVTELLDLLGQWD